MVWKRLDVTKKDLGESLVSADWIPFLGDIGKTMVPSAYIAYVFGRAGVIPAAIVILIGFLGIWLAVVRQTVTRRKSRSRLDGQGPDGHCEHNRGVE